MRTLLLAAALALAASPSLAQVGTASWYGPGFHGKRTASGEIYNQHAMTCAHPWLRFGTVVRITLMHRLNVQATCRVNDRGPFVRGRIIDVSRAVAERLGMIRAGTAEVRLSWR